MKKRIYVWSDIERLIKMKLIDGKFSRPEYELLLEICNAKDLNPYNKDVYLLPYKGKGSVITDYKVFFRKADETGRYCGLDDVTYNHRYEKGILVSNTKAELIQQNLLPVSCHVTIWKMVGGQKVAFQASIAVKEYLKSNHQHSNMPFTMLDKTVKKQAVVMAFPSETGGLNIKEELDAINGETGDKDPSPIKAVMPRNIKFDLTEKVIPINSEEQAEMAEIFEYIVQRTNEINVLPVESRLHEIDKFWNENSEVWKEDKDICKAFVDAKKQILVSVKDFIIEEGLVLINSSISEINKLNLDKRLASLESLWNDNATKWKPYKELTSIVKTFKEKIISDIKAETNE